jgi:hypothetical protein
MHVSDLAIEQVEHLGYFCVKALLQIVPGRLAITLYTVCERTRHIPRNAHLAVVDLCLGEVRTRLEAGDV